MDSNQNIFKLSLILEKLSDMDNGFTHKIFYNSNKELTGIVYMISAMRSNYEIFGDFISLDAQAKKHDNIHWPYISGVVINDSTNQL